MKLIFWNCRGAGNEKFRTNFKDIFNDHMPDMVAVFETKINFDSIETFFNHFGLAESFTVDPVGRVGGIWLLWNPSKISIKLFHASQQVIHGIVTRGGYEEWLLSAVYASPIHAVRDQLWTNLSMVAEHYNYPWLVAGDFNDHAESGEKRSFSNISDTIRTGRFRDSVNSCNLVDLGSSGPRLTWSNGRQGMANTLVRLDRALANPEWRLKFPEAAVSNLPRIYSDHCPILVNTEGSIKINTDGGVTSGFGLASFGGVVRSDEGKWIEGFCGYLGAATPLKAELWALRQAMRLCKERGWFAAPIESDCLLAIDLINNADDVDNHPDRSLIIDCKNLKAELESPISHIPREANMVADKLARIGVCQREQLVKMLIPPVEIVGLMFEDINGNGIQRAI